MTLFKRKIQYYIYVIYNSLLWIVSTRITKVKFHYWNANYGKGFKAHGRVKIMNMNSILIGDNVRLISGFGNVVGGEMKLCLYCGQNGEIIIGSNTGISNSVLVSQDKIVIGKNVFIGGCTRIYDNDFHPHHSAERNLNKVQVIPTRPIEIGDNVFIGGHSIILKGTKIGEGSIIGAGSVVSGSIPSNQIWGGNPARFIRDL